MDMEDHEKGMPAGKSYSPKEEMEMESKNGSVSVTPIPLATTPVPVIQQPEPVKTLWICSIMVRRYKLWFAVTLCMHIGLLAITGILLLADYDLFPMDFTDVPINIRDSKHFLQAEAWRYRDESDDLVGKNSSAEVIGERSRVGDRLQLIFEADNILSVERLTALKKVEDDLIAKEDYTDYCQMDYSGATPTCLKPSSIIRIFDGTYGNDFNDLTFSNIPDFINRAYNRDDIRGNILPLVGKDSVLQGNVKISLVRTFISMGLPFQGHDMKEDGLNDQRDKIQDFQVDRFRGYVEDLHDDGIAGMSVLYFSNQLRLAAIDPEILNGLGLAAGAMMFIYILLIIHNNSILLSTMAVFSIITSFCGTNLLYNLVYRYKYFGMFHMLGVFVILGIGADDVFVFIDSWRAAGHEGYTDTAERLTVCYKRASKAMLITSLTTFAAFFSSAFSPLLMTSSFGVFAATLVMFNYLSVIIFFPGVVILHHFVWEDKTWPCCRCCKKDNSEKKENIIVRFFKGPFFQLVTHKYLRFVIILMSLGVLAGFAVSAAGLEPAKGQFKMFKKGNNFREANEKQVDSFLAPFQNYEVEVFLVWGLKKQDYSGCYSKGIGCHGETVWDDTFNLNPTDAQTTLNTLCDTVKSMSDDDAKTLKAQTDHTSGDIDVSCFIQNMNSYLTTEESLSIPLTQTNVGPFVSSHTDLYDGSDFNAQFDRYFETAMSYWLNDKYSGDTTEDYRTYSQYLGEIRDDTSTHEILKQTGRTLYYGTRLQYAGIRVKTTLVPHTTGYEEGNKIKDGWENYFENLKKSLPSSLSGGFQCTPVGEWEWYDIQEVLATSAVQGILIGICLAFVVLTLATMNIVIGFLATLNIICVTVSVIGVLPMAGWPLGIMESLNTSLVVGLAVDYVVHLAEAYHDADETDGRAGKVREMLTRVGVSILFGAITTLGSSMFMVFAELHFYYEFGLFIFITIAFSIFYAFFLFSPVMSIIGPVGEFGSLMVIWRWLKQKCKCCFCCKKATGPSNA